MDSETHTIIKIESAKRKMSMKKLVHNAVIEYLERHEAEWDETDLTPEIMEKIKVCACKVFEPKNVKTKWIKNLIKIVAKKLNMREDIVRKSIKKLVGYGTLIMDYKDEISYDPKWDESLEESIKTLISE